MLQTQDAIGQLADRIERAYRRRHPGWRPVGLTPGLWESAAARLCEAADHDPATPVDPELFVAAQPLAGGRLDPWVELTERRSLDRYLRAVRRIIGQLRGELEGEVRRAERRMGRGATLDQVLATQESRISPLSRYILAHRAGRADLSTRLRAAVEVQDRACPLYRPASRALLPAAAYPAPTPRETPGFADTHAQAVSLK